MVAVCHCDIDGNAEMENMKMQQRRLDPIIYGVAATVLASTPVGLGANLSALGGMRMCGMTPSFDI